MISGAHAIVYSTSPVEDRAFFRDVLGLPHVDVGDGWLIFGLPPAEVAVHPSEPSVESHTQETVTVLGSAPRGREPLRPKGAAMPRFATREGYEAWKAAGRPSEPAERVTPAAADPAPAPPVKQKQGLADAFRGLPGWAWPFIVGCMAVPIVSLGGAIPGALGFGGAAGCASVAKKADWEVTPRVVTCAGITGGVWLLFVLLAMVFAQLRS